MNVLSLAEMLKNCLQEYYECNKTLVRKSFGLQVFELNDSSNKPTHFQLQVINQKNSRNKELYDHQRKISKKAHLSHKVTLR